MLIEYSPSDRERKVQFGTAFFIDSKHLVTAGHNTYGPNGPLKKVRITTPGLPHIDYLKLMGGKVATIECNVVGTLYEKVGQYETDISILHSGSYNAPEFLRLSADVPTASDPVYIVGYPGELKLEWMRTQAGIKNADESLQATAKLLPIRTLTVSSGTVQSSGAMVTYQLTTCPGMSGSCVLYNGRVIGSDKTLKY